MKMISKTLATTAAICFAFGSTAATAQQSAAASTCAGQAAGCVLPVEGTPPVAVEPVEESAGLGWLLPALLAAAAIVGAILLLDDDDDDLPESP